MGVPTPGDLPAAEDSILLFAARFATQLNAQNPWPGLAPYDEGSSGLFKGRAREAAELCRLVRLAPLTVLYGKSGLGKSSLLQAGLFPLLRAERFLPVQALIELSADAPHPLEQLARRLDEAIAGSDADAPARHKDETPWEYLHRKNFEIWSKDNHLLTPVLVFDQFEALFIRAGEEGGLADALLDHLADLAENRIPQQVASDRARSERLDVLAQRYRVVLAFREDYLPDLRTWEQKVPSLLRNDLRLEPMSRPQAIEAVMQAGEAVLATGAATRIVDFVAATDTGPRRGLPVVEPVLLSLCCYQLNRRRAAGALIDAALVQTAGEGILEEFYVDALKGLPESVALFVETHLIQGDRSRGSYARDEAIRQGFIGAADLETLTDRNRLLRIEDQTGTARIELIHDRLIEVVRRARGVRRAQQTLAVQQQLRADAEQTAERERRQREVSEADRARMRRLQRGLVLLLVVALAVATLAIWSSQRAEQSEAAFAAFSREATGARLVAEAQAMLGGVRGEGDERALQQLAAAFRLSSGPVTEGGLLDGLVERSALLKLVPARAPLRALAISPDGQRIVGVGEQGVQLWNATTGRPVESGSNSSVGALRTVAFNLDGSRFVTGGEDRRLRLWDGNSGTLLAESDEDAGDRINAAAFSPNGRIVVSASGNGAVRLWHVRTAGLSAGSEIGRDDSEVLSVAFSPDGSLVAAGYADFRLRVRRTTTGALVGRVWGGGAGPIRQLAFSPDGDRLVFHSGRRWVQLLELDDNRDIRDGTLINTGVETSAVAFVGPDGNALATAGRDGNVRLWDALRPDSPIDVLKGHRNELTALAISRDGHRLISGGTDAYVRVWNTRERGLGVNLEAQSGIGWAPRYSPDGRRIAACSPGGSLGLWDAATLAAIGSVSGERRTELLSLAFSTTGERIVTGDRDGSLQLWDVAAGQLSAQGRPGFGHAGRVNSVAFGPDGRRIVSGGDDGTLRLWDGRDLSQTSRPLRGHEAKVTGVAFNPSGSRIASASDDGSLRVWDVESGEPAVAPVTAHPGGVSGLAYSPDGRRIVTGGRDGVVRTWDASSGASTGRPLEGHKDGVRSVAISPDGRRIVVSSWADTLRFWDFRSGTPIGPTLLAPWGSGGGGGVTFSPDGRQVIAGAEGSEPHVWPAPDAWPDAVCSKLTRNMSVAQWRAWVGPRFEYQTACPSLPIAADNDGTKGNSASQRN